RWRGRERTRRRASCGLRARNQPGAPPAGVSGTTSGPALRPPRPRGRKGRPMDSPRSPSAPLARIQWALPVALAAWMTWTGVRATSAVHSPAALAGLAGLHGLLATTLFLASRFAVRAGRVAGACACLAFALVPAAQLRLDAGLLQRTPVL